MIKLTPEHVGGRVLLRRILSIQIILFCAYFVFLVETCSDHDDRKAMINELQEIKTAIQENNEEFK